MEDHLKLVKLSRDTLAASKVRVLNRGGAGNPDVLLVRQGDDFCVVKDFAPRGALTRAFAPRLVRREMRAYRQLAGHPFVPLLIAEIDELAFAVEYRPGRILGPTLADFVPKSFIDDLRGAVDEMHARGVVHLDLRHRSNALATRAGEPVLIDFASALCFRPGGFAARVILPWLAWIDRRAVDKWERQLRSGRAKKRDTGAQRDGR